MFNPALVAADRPQFERAGGIPAVFCWTKMGSEAGQPLTNIVQRKELERQCGAGVFAWGIGNSVGPAIRYAKYAERITALDALFTPMKSAPKAIDVSPSSVLWWRGYHGDDGQIHRLAGHMLVTSRGHSGAGEKKRGHYALICRSQRSLLEQSGEVAIDPRALRNLVSANPVGASQVTSVVRYQPREATESAYPVLFRAKLTDAAFVRLAMPVVLADDLYEGYLAVCASRTESEWKMRLNELRDAAPSQRPKRVQARLF